MRAMTSTFGGKKSRSFMEGSSRARSYHVDAVRTRGGGVVRLAKLSAAIDACAGGAPDWPDLARGAGTIAEKHSAGLRKTSQAPSFTREARERLAAESRAFRALARLCRSASISPRLDALEALRRAHALALEA
jgi:hypothetical protein